MTTHVFIVDSNTLKYHLEYMFAGTGAKDSNIDFNDCSNTKHHSNSEPILVNMIADASRIRKNDFIIFYLQQNFKKGIKEGKFYGIFQAKEDFSFLDDNDDKQFLKKELKKSLTFRTLIKPYEVYSEGVTEWEALDEIKEISSPNQMLWSLIYRKLKGNRGNTMITIYESERLRKLIKDKNKHKPIKSKYYTFDSNIQQIIKSDIPKKYTGRKVEINILPRLIQKYNESKSFEDHLQAYIVKNIGKGNQSLNKIIPGEYEVEWIGNEVSCGVGMQRIDVMISLKNNMNKIIAPIELKANKAKYEIIYQIQRYVNWLNQYYIPNRISDIQPIIISKKFRDKTKQDYYKLIENLIKFNNENPNCLPIKYIEFEIKNDDLIFTEIEYQKN